MDSQANVSTTGDQADGSDDSRKVTAADIVTSSEGVELAVDVVCAAIGAFFDAIS